MGLFLDSFLLELGIGVATLLFAVYVYITRNFSFWVKKGIPYLKPTAFFGNYKDVFLLRETAGILLKNMYLEAKDKPYIGIFAIDQPLLLVRDNELIKRILVKDFNSFVDRNFCPDENIDPLTHKGLFGTTGQKWRNLRVKLTPTFTSGKMKRMFHLVDECGKHLLKYMETHIEGGVLEVKDTMARYTTDVISTCAFGIEGDALKTDNSTIRAMLKRIFDLNYIEGIGLVTSFFAPGLLKTLRIKITNNSTVDFVRKTVWDTVEYREKNDVVRKDFLDLMMQIRKNGHVDDDDANSTTPKSSDNFELEGDDFVAQCFIFLAAGFETSSTTMSFALYELAFQPEIQDRLRTEIQTVFEKNDGQVTYEGLQEMTYLDKVVNETLRKYPVLPFLDRKVTVPYTLPNSDIQLEKDTVIIIPVMGIHYDPTFYPNPERFDPENFSEERKRSRPNYTHLPFGDGPRNCIGNRMGLTQVKVGLVHVLLNYEVTPCLQTPTTLKYNPLNTLLSTLDGMPLRFKRTSTA